MGNINSITGPDSYRVELAQICWVIPDIHAAVKFLSNALGIAGFPKPDSGQSMFHDYLARYPTGGIQHNAFRLPVNGFESVTNDLREQDYVVISEVDHPIARMAFFDTYKTLGVVTEIMGITPEGWKAVEQNAEGR